MSTIEIKNVSKAYGKTVALKNVSATITDGKICGFLGRNGAGKTTLLNIITNRIIRRPGSGVDRWRTGGRKRPGPGENLLHDRKDPVPERYEGAGCVPTDPRLLPAVRPGLRRLPWPSASSWRPDKKIGGLSTGYLSIFKLILTLASNAPVIIFDEPVLGLDANHRDLFYKELLAHYNAAPNTVILSTHLIEEAAGLLEEVIIIKEGQILLTQPVEELLQLAYTVSGSQENVDRYTAGKKVIREEALGRFKAATIYQKRNGTDQETLAQLGLDLTPARLQELFISLTN